ncbi:MAG: aspartate-semialdehyde dehydrogenase [Gammaproteobacteria bacterium]|nr:aspartate-semialdehyde dehydrogenase [Gammaproteobacteria bacterium]
MFNNQKVSVAIVGATGAVGEALIDILQERKFPVETLYLLASQRSAGRRIQFHGKSVMVQVLDEFDFSQVQIGFFSAGGGLSAEFAPKAAAAGCIVIDNTSHFRYEDDIPLIVPEVNADQISAYSNHNIIANPNCSTIQMVAALKPIQDAVGIARINVCTYQAVSGAGAGGVRELAAQTTNLLAMKDLETKVMPVQIAFNVIPQIDKFMDNGYTKEEMKMVWETRKILQDEDLQVNPTCVRVPVFYGHSEAVHIETKTQISALEVTQLLSLSPGIKVFTDETYPTAVEHAVGTDPVYVGRIREDISHPNGINMWVVSDNVRKGAALNSVQIAELLLNIQ